MNTRYEPPRLAAEQAEPQRATGSAQGQALDAARAEFRAAWQANLDREWETVETMNRIAKWSDRLSSALLVLGGGGGLLLKLRFGVTLPNDVLLVGALGLWSCNLINTAALVAGAHHKQFAERLEAGEISHP